MGGNQVLPWDRVIAVHLSKGLAVWMDNLEQHTRLPDQHKYNFGQPGSRVFQRSLGILQSRRKKRLGSLRGKGMNRLDCSLEDSQIQSSNLPLEDNLVVVRKGIWNCLDSHRPWKDIHSVILLMSIQVEQHNGSRARKDLAWRYPDLDAGSSGTLYTAHLQIC